MKKVSIDNNSLAHTKWNCKYHIVFAPKYRRKIFFAEKVRDKGNTSAIMPVERSGINRGRSMPGSYTYVGKHPAQDERFGIYGISKGKKCPVNISEIWKYEVRIPKSRILV